MLLAIDMGNSSISCGFFHNRQLLRRGRLKTEREYSAADYSQAFLAMLEERDLKPSALSCIVISSVTPELNALLEETCMLAFNQRPLFVGRDLKLFHHVPPHCTDEVGPDLLVNAFAAFKLYERALVIVDIGTATTFQAIDASGSFLGVAIAPGMEISSRALFETASMLAPMKLSLPKKTIGTNTHDALASGIYFGHALMIDAMVAKMKKEFNTNAHCVATGGLAESFAELCHSFDSVDSDLTLKGLELLWSASRVGLSSI